MFAIGDADWPGISKLQEEIGEVGQVCGKLVGTRGRIQDWDGSNLKLRLEEELADSMAASMFVITHCDLDKEAISRRTAAKLVIFEKWHAGEDPLLPEK